jgi:dienelactone hydrolase
MTRFLLLVLLATNTAFSQDCDPLLLESTMNSGTYAYNEFVEADGMRDGSDYDGATIYYPTNTSEIHASIIIAPGYLNTELTIQNWGPFLASHGIVTMTIGTNGLTDTHLQRRDALLDAKQTLIDENQRQQSPLYGVLDIERIAVGGFSKGGGGAQMAAGADPSFKAVIALYPWLEDPIEEDLNHAIPVLIISGELDFIAPPSEHANIHYDYTPSSTLKLKYEVQLATHDAIGGPFGGYNEVGSKTLAWLKTFLLEDDCYCPLLSLVPESASQFTTNVECQSTSVIQQFKNDQKSLVKVTDILGKEIDQKPTGQILFFFYNDGTMEKRIISDWR